MVAFENLVGVAIIALGMVLTPGPNMVYLTSRAISQGRMAGMISLAGMGFEVQQGYQTEMFIWHSCQGRRKA